MIGYLRAKGSIIAFQKALTQTGRTSKEALEIEMQNLPSPLEGATVGNKQLDSFQENIDTASEGLTRVPWLPSPQEVRTTIEQEAATKTAQTQRANQVFQTNQATQTGQCKNASGNKMNVGEEAYDTQRRYIGKVSKVYADGSYDIQHD